MSTDKWAYDPAKCDGEICVGDCDNCPRGWLLEPVWTDEVEDDE